MEIHSSVLSIAVVLFGKDKVSAVGVTFSYHYPFDKDSSGRILCHSHEKEVATDRHPKSGRAISAAVRSEEAHQLVVPSGLQQSTNGYVLADIRIK